MFKSIIFLITSKCNLSCLHCYAPKKMKDMDTFTIIKFLKEAKKEGIEHICLTGGEPLLREDIFLIIEEIKKMGYKITLFTNATSMDKSTASFLSNWEIFLYVSIDGVSSSIVDSIRGKNSFKKIIKGIEILKEEKVPFATVFCLNKLNQNEALYFGEFSKNLGASFCAFIPIIPNKPNTLSLLPDEEDLKEIALEIRDRSFQNKYSSHFWCIPSLTPLNNKYFKVWPCNYKSMDIDPEGYLKLCDTLNFKILNIKGKSFEEIKKEYLNHPHIKRLSQELEKACPGCIFRDKCQGGCWARSFIKEGSFSKGDPLCFFKKYLGRPIKHVA